jgi:hypothetical protein
MYTEPSTASRHTTWSVESSSPMRPVLVTESVVRDLKRLATAAAPCETGGILVGVRTRRTVWIVGAIELATERSPEHYTVPRGATRPAVLRARETIDPRVGYAGEWHSYTDGAGPSSADRSVMRSIAWFVPHPAVGGPCLLLVRRTAAGFAVYGYRAQFPRLVHVPLLLTGSLPPAATAVASRHLGRRVNRR